MMMNLFEIFDPSTSSNFNMNWISLLLILLPPFMFWVTPNRMSILILLFMKFIFNDFKLLSTNKYKLNILMFMNLLMMILIYNLLGLFPFVFTSTSHLSINLSMALPMWLSFTMYMMKNKHKKLLAHLVPLNTPSMLMNFMVLIEFISNIIRPWTLSIRLTANMIAGHLLLTLLGNFISLYSNILPSLMIMIPIQNLLFLLEISVAFIQSYVFSILTLLYFSENK